MASIINKVIVKRGYLTGLLMGILLGLIESLRINFSIENVAPFREWILFYVIAIAFYGLLGTISGMAISGLIIGLSALFKRFLRVEIYEKCQFALLLGGLFGIPLFICLRLYVFLALDFWLSLFMFLGSFLIFSLTFFIAEPFIPNWVKRSELRNGKITAIVLMVLALGFMIFFLATLLPQRSLVPVASQDQQKQMNVLLITIDTLRADHLGCYGYKEIKTPILDGLAERGTIFTQHICQQPITTASHASLLTSTYPVSNGVQSNNIPLDATIIRLPEILSQYGYATGAFVSGYPLQAYASALDQGFQHYDDKFFIVDYLPGQLPKWFMQLTVMGIVEKYLQLRGFMIIIQRRGDQTNEAALKWLDRIEKEKFFLWVHYYDPHTPYDPPAPFNTLYDPNYQGKIDGSMKTLSKIWDKKITLSSDDIRHLIALYDGEISFVDQEIGVLIKKLEQMGIMDHTIIIVTADHGESLWEHDYHFKHGDFLYEGSIRIPLIIFTPGETTVQKVIDFPTENIDIVPTLLEILMIPQPQSMQGESLLGLMKGEKNHKKTIAFSQCIGKKRESDRFEAHKYSIRTVGWKFIRNEGEEDEIYNIKQDPEELYNLITSQPQIKEALKRVLDDNLSSLKRAEIHTTPRDADTLRKLKSLGYIN